MTEIYLTGALLITTLGFLYWFWFSPIGVLRMKELAGGEIQIDVRLYYSPATLYRIFDAYGDKGRDDFRRMLLVDMAFPIVYAAALSCLADVLSDHGVIAGWIKINTCVAATSSAVFDYCENIMLLWILKIFPERHRTLAYAAACASSLKILGSYAAILFLALGVAGMLF